MKKSNPVTAAFWMTGAIFSFTTMAVAGRELAGQLNPFELMFYRSLVAVGVISILLQSSRGGFSQLRTSIPREHVFRNVGHFMGQSSWFYAVGVIPFAPLVALEFTNPIWVALLAPFLLGEAMTRSRLFAAGLGFIGILVVSRPGLAPLEWGHGAAMLAAFGFALATLFTRRIMAHDTVLCVLFWMAASQAVMGFLLALPGGIPMPHGIGWFWTVVVALVGLSAHFSLTSALRHAPAAVVAPMEFGRLPFISIVGVWVYAETLEWPVLLGALLILAGNFIGISGERRRQNVAH